MEQLLSLQQGVPADGLACLVAGRPCASLETLAARVSPSTLSSLYASLVELAAQPGRVWSKLTDGGVNAEHFMTMMMALFGDKRAEIAPAAAACYIAAMRCGGATGAGILHPVVVFSLLKVVRAQLSTAGLTAAVESVKSGKSGRSAKETIAPNRETTAHRSNRPQRSTAEPTGSLNEDELERGSGGGGGGGGGDLCAASEGDDRLLREIVSLLESLPLRDHPDVLGQLVAALAEAASNSRGAAAETVYSALGQCLRPAHGEIGETAQVVLRPLVRHLSLSDAESAAAPTKAQLEAQSACVRFVVATWAHWRTEGEASEQEALLETMQALMQHASLRSPERTDARIAVCAALAQVLRSLPPSASRRYALFLWRYAHTAKVGARAFAVEMAAEMLLGALADDQNAMADATKGPSTLLAAEAVPQILWRLIIQRVSDKVAPRVLATLPLPHPSTQPHPST